ncbi:hypothetical protein BH11ACT8_BH11ACT8_22450 [soil metagenome]
MPNPAFEKLKQAVTGTLTTAITVGDKAYRTAAPVVRRTAGDVFAWVRLDPAARETPRFPGAATDAPGGEASEAPPATRINPAAVAKNIPHQRPVAKPAPRIEPDPESSPGGKLPPRR